MLIKNDKRHWTEIIPLEAIHLKALPKGQFTPEKQRRFCEVMIEYYDKVMNEHPEDREEAAWAKAMWQTTLEEVQS
jgi:hypothetical protein